MKLKQLFYSMLIFPFYGCNQQSKQPFSLSKTKSLSILQEPLSVNKGALAEIPFDTLIGSFAPIALPCSTQLINDPYYCVRPFPKNISYFNQLSTAIIDYKAAPKQAISCLYDNSGSDYPAFELEKVYLEDSLAYPFHGGHLSLKTKKLTMLLCKSKVKFYDSYLLIFSSDGKLISGLQMTARSSNNVTAFKRAGFIDKDCNIAITDLGTDRNCEKAGFKVEYLYKINETGTIYKVKEMITYLDTINIQEFRSFGQ